MREIFGTEVLLDGAELLALLMRLSLDLGVTAVVVLAVYYRVHRSRDFVFTYFIFNIITFSVCMLLRKVPMELGFALGLFAVFGILRYRTEEIRLRDLTYMFVVIGIGIINSVANERVSFGELAAVNVVISVAAAVLEFHPALRRSHATALHYDDLGMLHPGRRAELFADLEARLGMSVTRVEVHRIDLLRDAAELTVFHSVRSGEP